MYFFRRRQSSVYSASKTQTHFHYIRILFFIYYNRQTYSTVIYWRHTVLWLIGDIQYCALLALQWWGFRSHWSVDNTWAKTCGIIIQIITVPSLSRGFASWRWRTRQCRPRAWKTPPRPTRRVPTWGCWRCRLLLSRWIWTRQQCPTRTRRTAGVIT